MEKPLEAELEIAHEPPVVPQEAQETPQPEPSPKHAKIVGKGSIRKRPRKKYEPVFFVNSLALIACVFGILCIMLPWVHDVSNSNDNYYGFAHYANDSDLRFGLSIGLMIVGSFMVLLVRVFGVVQLAGVLLFLLALKDDFTGHTLGYLLGSMTTGFYLGLVGGVLGTTSMVFRHAVPVSERFLTFVRSPDGMVYRFNLLSVAAGIVGVISIFLPWFVERETIHYFNIVQTYDWSLFSAFSGDWMPFMMSAAALFLFGSVVSFLTPLGGIPQLLGVLFYMNGIILDFQDFHSTTYFDSTLSFGPGLYLGLVAAIAAIASVIVTRRLMVPVDFFSFKASDRHRVPLESTTKILTTSKPALPWTFRKTLRMSLFCAVVFALVAAPIIIAYGAPLSKLSVMINNYDQELTGRAIVYVDDKPTWTLTIPPASQVVQSMKVSAGWHNIGVDSAIPGRTLEDMPDGKIDWSTSVRVKPMIGAIVSSEIGSFGWNSRVGNITIASAPSEVVITFDGFTQFMYGQPYSSEVSWYDVDVLLTDGSSWIGWSNLTSIDLIGFAPPAIWHYGSPKALGTHDVWLNVTDLAANGEANGGDFFTLETGGGSFDSDSTYTVYVIDAASGNLLCKGTY